MPTSQSSILVNHTLLMFVEIGCPLTHAQLCGSLTIIHIAVLDRTTYREMEIDLCNVFQLHIYYNIYWKCISSIYENNFPKNCYKLNQSHWSQPSRSVLSLFALVLQELECVLSWPFGRAYPQIQFAATAPFTQGAQVDRFRCPSRSTLLIYH